MSSRTRSAITFPLALLSILAIVTFWINKTVQPLAPKLDGSGRHDPDYIMSNFVTTQTDALGALRFKLAAAEMKHFPDDDTTSLQHPRYMQFASGKLYTQVEGLRGFVSSNGEEVELIDNVKVIRQSLAGKDEMTVDTNYLKILPNEELALTESPVVIKQAPKTVIYATGMIYEKKNSTVTLLHKVRAHYEKPNNKNVDIDTSKVIKPTTNDPVKETKKTMPIIPKKLSANKPAKHNKTKTTSTNARIRRRYD